MKVSMVYVIRNGRNKKIIKIVLSLCPIVKYRKYILKYILSEIKYEKKKNKSLKQHTVKLSKEIGEFFSRTYDA